MSRQVNSDVLLGRMGLSNAEALRLEASEKGLAGTEGPSVFKISFSWIRSAIPSHKSSISSKRSDRVDWVETLFLTLVRITS